MDIKVKYLHGQVPLEYIGGEKSNWVDLRAASTVHLAKGEYALIPLGVAMQLPEGYEAIVAPRSSTFGRHGILMANSIGVIDESYCGDRDEWQFPALAVRSTVIEKGTRIAKFRVIKHQPGLEFLEVPELTGPNRGGFGSTGVR